MSSAILLIIVACCGFVHAGPYHGRRVSEIPQYDYDLEESDNYEYPSAPEERIAPADVDISVHSLEDSVGKTDRRNEKRYPMKSYRSLSDPHEYPPRNHPPQNRKLSRRSSGKNAGRYIENINIHDNRDIWGSFSPQKSKSYMGGDSGSAAGSNVDYSEERGKYGDWNENINTFQVTDQPHVPNYSDEVPENNGPDIMEKLKMELSKTEKPSKELVEPSKVRETTPKEEPWKFPEEPTKVTEKPPKVTTEHPRVSTEAPEVAADPPKLSEESPEISAQSPEIIIEPPKTSKESLKVQKEPPKVATQPPKVTTKVVKISTEISKVTTEPPKVTTEPLKLSKKPPNVTTEPPKVVTEPPKTSKVSPQVTQEPTKVTETLKTSAATSEVTTEPPKASKETVKVITEPLEVTTEPPKVTTEPPKVSKETPKVTTELPKTSENSPKLTQPAKVTTEPPKVSEESETVTTQSSKVSEEPPKASENLPQVTTDFPLKSVEPHKEPSEPLEEKQCTNGRPKTNQRYSLSFPSTNFSAQPKHTTTLHSKDELTLCWIETVTTKEDNTTSPPKRLVVREYTVTFENSVLIPDEHLWCPRVEGEIHPTSKEEAVNTPFQEYFANDTRRSQVTQLKKVDHEDNLTVVEEKSIRCGIGSFITKNIYESSDIPDNPLMRVEVKVGPSLKHITDTPDETTTPESPDEVPSITVDCLIDGTCSTPKSTSTTTEPSESSSDKIPEESAEPYSESSCELGDESCVRSSTYPPVEVYGDENSPETSKEITLVPEDLVCDNSTGKCGITRSTSGETVTSVSEGPGDEPAFGDGTASEGLKEPDASTQTESTPSEEETPSGENVTFPIATRTTFPTTLWTEAHSTHKPRYALKLQVVLERIDENDNRQTVVNLKKEVALNHKNRTYMDLLDALNDTVNDLGVIRDLLKCSAFEGISPIIWGYVGSDEENNATRRTRSLPVAASQNASEKEEILEQCLPDIRTDISTGLTEIKSQLSKNDGGDILGKNADVLPTRTSNFENDDVKVRRSRRSADAGDREAISHWSNVRFREASDGGKIRSFTELVVLENSEVV
ncbi:proteoglycan 4 [Diachasma alloeum]|uniref:proteoglycan 4 n=1 Tax=Diachasma alloeum TaxID=454923 RepID=UPI00073836C0|nr:proteoglycan 4 [Diachasma alloeum]